MSSVKINHDKDNKKKKRWKIVYAERFYAALLTVAALIMAGTILALGVLPMKFFIALVAVLAVIVACMYFFVKKAKKGWPRVIARVLSLVLTIAMLVGSLYAAQASSFLARISGSKDLVYMQVMVLKDSKCKKLADLDGKTYGVVDKVDEENIRLTIKEINKKQGAIKVEHLDSPDALTTALYNKEVDAIIINKANVKSITDNHSDFKKKTTLIWEYVITKDIKDAAKKVDVTKDGFTVLVNGIDAQEGGVDQAANSDVNMLVTVNPTTKQILMVSIPRDYYVELASFGAYDKLTHSGSYGIEETRKTLEKLFNVDVNYTAKANFNAVKDLVDAVGGVDVYSDLEMTLRDEDGIDKYIKEGMNHMDGPTALRFARERSSYEEGDNHRIKNQQDVLKAIIKKLTSPAIISDYSSILDALGDNMNTSMKASDLKKLAKMQISDGASWDIQQYQVTGYDGSSSECYSYPGPSLYVMYPNEETVEIATQKIKAVLNGEKS